MFLGAAQRIPVQIEVNTDRCSLHLMIIILLVHILFKCSPLFSIIEINIHQLIFYVVAL